ncbi:MAG: SDR family NAD(P)-dependent oxidoreductase [Pseudomonadota bacterium]
MTSDAPRTVLITGCSSGIGLDAARRLSAEGWRVLATCRQAEDCARLHAEGLESFPLDHASPESVAAGAEETLRRAEGALHGVFLNGAYALPGALEDVSRDALRDILEANLLGPHDLARRLMPALRARGEGRIIACSSVFGRLSLRYRGPYNITKFALEAWADALRREIEGAESPMPGIRVSLILPGPIRTPFRAKSARRFEARIDPQASAWAAAYRDRILPRLYAEDPPDLAPMERAPEAVTRALRHALTARRPKARYFVTPATWIVEALVRALPSRALDRVFAGDV